ncbi:MAG: DNA-binding protein [Candidatus Melainabacteria bacterium]|nr:DNA-binding protein [Candidatus Melainabacteria bacterium]
MARNVGIERDEVFETANRLEAEGKEVTALAMLAALGRGSLTTIYKYLDAWKHAKPVKTPSVQTEPPDQVKSAFATAWRVAAEEAARETMVMREKAAEEVSAALKQFQGALEAIAKLEADREADAEVLEGLQKITAGQKAEIAKLETEVATEHARAEELRDQLKAQQSDRDVAMKEAAEYKGRAETLKTQNEALLSKIGSADKQEKKR